MLPDETFNDALELPPGERPAFLDRACGADTALRAEVESLLAVFARNPPPEEAAPPEPLRQIGRYVILSELGQGGMGRVFLAHDPTLDRRVALKVLPHRGLYEPAQLARFQREAQILARLSHPNVATLFSLEQADGIPFLTMQLVTGETLTERIARSPSGTGVGVRATLEIGVQIARALETAHGLGIVHRDLKPANVAVTAEGEVKLLDFGLAKVIESNVGSAKASDDGDSLSEATSAPEHTLAGTMLGSPGYMSPEQIQGHAAGPASDLWALGCILFECLCGRPAFSGATTAERIRATLNADPDWNVLPASTPNRLRRLVGQCLIKDPAARLPSAGRVRGELESIMGDAAATVPADTRKRAGFLRELSRGSRLRTAGAITALGVVAAVVWAIWPRPNSLQKMPPPDPTPTQLTFTGQVKSFDLSPDDRSVVYASRTGELVLLPLEGGREKVLHRAEVINGPYWSPDGSAILFTAKTADTGRGAFILRTDDGSVRPIGPATAAAYGWTPEGEKIVAWAPRFGRGPAPLILVDRVSGEAESMLGGERFGAIGTVQVSPAGGPVVIGGTDAQGSGGYWVATDVHQPTRRIPWDAPISSPHWSPNGASLLYSVRKDGVFVLEKQPVDPETGDFLSHPTELYRMVEGASYTMFHRSDRALYTVGGTVSTLWCADRSERGTWSTRSVLSWTFALLDPRLSPDSRNVAMIQNTDRARDLIVISLDDDSAHHVASFETTASSPAWSPDGGRIALCASNGSGKRVWLVDASGGPPRVLSQRDCGGYVYWNTDARIRYQSVEEMYRNYFFIDPLTGEESALFHGEPRGSVFHSSISPDGRWMAVGGNRNGFTDVKVWLIDVLSQEERLLYDEPAAPIGWSGDRGSVFLTLEPLASRSPGTGVARILRVPVSGEEAEVVLELPQGKLEGWGHADISPDGNRVVAVLVQNGQNLWVADCALPDVKMP